MPNIFYMMKLKANMSLTALRTTERRATSIEKCTKEVQLVVDLVEYYNHSHQCGSKT